MSSSTASPSPVESPPLPSIKKERVNWFTARGYAVDPQYLRGGEDPLAASSVPFVAQLKQKLQQDPYNASAHNALGVELVKANDYAGAEAEFREAIQVNSASALPHNNLGLLLASSQDSELAAAEQEFLEAIKLDGNLFQSHYNLAVLKERYARDLESAEQSYRNALRSNSSFGPALSALAMILVRKGPSASAEALTNFRAAVESEPENATYCYNLGMFLEQNLKDFNGAEEYYRRCVAKMPTHGPAHSNLGLLLRLHRKNTQGAEEEFRAALRCDSTDVIAASNLAALLQSQNRLDEAEHLLRETIQRVPSDAILYVALGRLMQYFKNDPAEACEAYEAALRYDPNNPEAHFGLGELHNLVERDQEVALEHYRCAVAADNTNAEAWAKLGLCLLKYRNDTPAAKVAFEQALALNPQDKRVRNELDIIWGQQSNGFKGRCVIA